MGFLGLGIHGYMLADEARNARLAHAIRSVVSPGDVVIDVGGGTGLLSVLAAKAGASRVYCIEASSLAALARNVIRDNGMEDRIEVIASLAQNAKLPERGDVVISETLGFMALDEGFRAAMSHARDNFLKTDGRLLPESVVLKIAAIEQSDAIPDVWSTPGVEEVDLSRATRTFSKIPRRVHLDPNLHISEPATLLELDCMTMETKGRLDFSCLLTCHTGATFGGFIIWFEAQLGDGVSMSSRAAHPSNHWGQAYIASPDINTVCIGDVLKLNGSISDEPGKFSMKCHSQVVTTDTGKLFNEAPIRTEDCGSTNIV